MKSHLVYGLIAVALVGCGGGGDGRDCSAAVNACNSIPVANAGGAQNVLVASTVTLDGTGSADADGNPLSYSWSFVSKPASSISILSSANASKASFVPDQAGIYLVSLTVNDGKVNSAPVTASITASNTNLSIAVAPFVGGSSIPLRLAATEVGGNNLSPQLSIGDVPKGTQWFAIIMDDEMSPCLPGLGACRHWGVFNLPVSKTLITEGENLLLQPGTVYGANSDKNTTAYLGPNRSGHTYSLTVYALQASAPFVTGKPEYNRAKFEIDYKEFILGKATITGVFP